MSIKLPSRIKHLVMIFSICFITNDTFAGALIESSLVDKKITLTETSFVSEYVWGYGPGPCLHLYRISESSYIDATGMHHPSVTITLMNDINYHGTHTICPPAGSWYV